MILYLNLFLSFAKIGFLSFGGMTMIPIINDEAVKYGWLTGRELMDIVAIAEMTPGSLGINCATFVGLCTGGVFGALCATLGTMTPSLTLCLLAAHLLHRFRENAALSQLLKGMRPVCIGMLLATAFSMGKSALWTGSRLSWNLVFIAVVSGFCLFKFRFSIPKTILLAAVLGVFMRY